jgi:hypothetical protein
MLGRLLAWAVAALFSAWFAISVASQLSDSVGTYFRRLSSLGLVPCWTFFAPRPGVDDIHLLYRDRLADGTIAKPTYVPTIEHRRWYHGIWNPNKFHNKVFYDLTSALRVQLRTIRKENFDPHTIMLSTPYIMMLHLVMRMPRPPDATARQFILANTRSKKADPEHAIIFLSGFHHFQKVRP